MTVATSIPRCPDTMSSDLRLAPSARTAALDIPYDAEYGCGTTPSRDEMLTMVPFP